MTVSDPYTVSNPVTRRVTVIAYNDPPVVPEAMNVYGSQDTQVAFLLAGYDVDSAVFYAMIDRVPTDGALFTCVNYVPGTDPALGAVTPGDALNVTGEFTHVDRCVVYVPGAGLSGWPLSVFSYVMIDDQGARSDIATVNVWVSSSLSPTIGSRTGLGNITSSDGSITVREDGSTELTLHLVQSPAPGEVVTITCASSSEFGTVAPATLVFTAGNYGTPQALVLTGHQDHVNGSPDIKYAIGCDTASVAPAGVTPVFGATTISLPAVTLDVVFPYFGDALVYRAGQWVPSLVANTSFLVVTKGGEVVRLTADTTFRLYSGPAFLPGVTLSLGGVVLPSLVLDDGYVLEFQTPNYSTACPTADACVGDGAFRTIVVTNPYAAPNSPLGGVVGCPEQCPGVAPSQGLLFADPCSGNFTYGAQCLDPTGAAACGLLLAANVTVPGVGSVNECSSCPSGAYCPGGSRVWAQPGFWVSNETSKDVAACAPPVLERCGGWDVATGLTGCGTAYKAGSPLCGACAEAHFPAPSGYCISCPFSGHAVTSFVVLFVLIAGVFVVLAVLVVGTTLRRGGTYAFGFKRGLEFLAWALLLAELMAQVRWCARVVCQCFWWGGGAS